MDLTEDDRRIVQGILRALRAGSSDPDASPELSVVLEMTADRMAEHLMSVRPTT